MNLFTLISRNGTIAYVAVFVVLSVMFLWLCRRQQIRLRGTGGKPGAFILYGTLLTCATLAAAGWFLAGRMGGVTRERIVNESRQYGQSVIAAIDGVLNSTDNVVDALSSASPLVSLHAMRTPETRESANMILDRFRTAFGAAVCYLLDTAGTTLVSSNRDTPESFVGKNYSFRPYFITSRSGGRGSYFALGVTSGTRGYYASAPVRDSTGIVTGVVVVKHDIDTLEALLRHAPPAMLCDSEGIVFMASSPDLLYRPLFPMDSVRRERHSRSRQFGIIKPQPVLENTSFTRELIMAGVHYIGVRCAVADRNLDAVFLVSPNQVRRSEMLALLGALVVIVWMYAAGVILMMERASASTAAQLASEQRVRTVISESRDALRESEVRFRSLADTLPEVVFEANLGGIFTYVNQSGFRVFGYTPEDLAGGISIFDTIAPQDVGRARENAVQIMQGESGGHHEYVALRRDGTPFPVIIHSVALMKEGRPAGIRGITMDISQRKRAEAQMLQADKLNALGVLAGGLAHDFNNLLAAVWSGLSLLRIGRADDPVVVETVTSLEEALRRGRDLTGQLLAYARGGAPIRTSASLRQIVEDTARFALSGSSCSLGITADEHLHPVDADPGQISQVIQNLLLNASQAMPGGGRIAVYLDNVESVAGDGLRPGKYVRLRLADQGPGVPPELTTRIFDPFFSTKPGGTGLGLATVYAIVTRHDGRITVDSPPEGGAEFTVVLPASLRCETLSTASQSPVVHSPGGRILLMDDDPVIRLLGLRLLTALGYRGVAVENGEEALCVFTDAHTKGDRFDALILDLTIKGGMGGKEIIATLRGIDPAILAIVSSGYYKDPVMAEFERHGFDAVLAKPYSMDELSATLATLLLRRGSATTFT